MNEYAEANKISKPYHYAKIRTLKVGDIVYVPFDNVETSDDVEKKETQIGACYLGKIISMGKSNAKVHFVDTTLMTGIPKKLEDAVTKVELTETVYQIFKSKKNKR